MNNDRFWRAISIDSVTPDHFPKIALYLKSGNNYVLYKDQDRNFTKDDYQRLERGLTRFLYVRSGDMEVLNDFLQDNLKSMLARDDLDSSAKGRLLYQTSINCVIDMFEAPETAANLSRCKHMVQHILDYTAADPHALESLQCMLDYNFYILAHTVQVTALTLLVHEKLYDLEPDEMLDVGIGSLIHDYGMTFISSEILDKNDALSDVEYYKVKQHTQKGYEFFKRIGTYSEIVLNIIRFHHERYDGNGYPAGLKGDEIPRSGQVAAICDVYSALIMDRAHRKAITHADAIRTMREEAKAGAFNQELFEEFAVLMNEKQSA